ncbi:MAG: dTDP-4-dehydrorhamnose 3,5-epimerase [Mesonia sp.]|uniref:dTDP-4-dehydrorhamnose 3,5-epimerase n=1 Tax=Mesonia sp. TaxID=1960830 RepID=UPI003F9D6F18
MKVQATKIKDCFIIEPRVFNDARGYFMESFNVNDFNTKTGLSVNFVQDNESHSAYGVIRGLHAQQGENAQAKLVRVINGEVLDAVVDLRPDSDTYFESFTIKLNAENKKQLFVPRGCLHGFSVLSETATFFYKCDNYYNKESEIGCRYDDPEFNINWQIPENKALVSEKDLKMPLFDSLKNK